MVVIPILVQVSGLLAVQTLLGYVMQFELRSVYDM